MTAAYCSGRVGVREIALKLAKLLGMLGSHHDGEVLNAARQAHKTVTNAGLTWREVFQPLIALPPPVIEKDQPRVLVDDLLGHPSLTDWESKFVGSIDRWLRRGRRLSRKQLATLEDLHDKHFGDQP